MKRWTPLLGLVFLMAACTDKRETCAQWNVNPAPEKALSTREALGIKSPMPMQYSDPSQVSIREVINENFRYCQFYK